VGQILRPGVFVELEGNATLLQESIGLNSDRNAGRYS
jgi:hypothetical protein